MDIEDDDIERFLTDEGGTVRMLFQFSKKENK